MDRGAFIYNGRDGYDLLLDWLSPTVDLTLAAPSVHRDGVAAALDDSASGWPWPWPWRRRLVWLTRVRSAAARPRASARGAGRARWR